MYWLSCTVIQRMRYFLECGFSFKWPLLYLLHYRKKPSRLPPCRITQVTSVSPLSKRPKRGTGSKKEKRTKQRTAEGNPVLIDLRHVKKGWLTDYDYTEILVLLVLSPSPVGRQKLSGNWWVSMLLLFVLAMRHWFFSQRFDIGSQVT